MESGWGGIWERGWVEPGFEFEAGVESGNEFEAGVESGVESGSEANVHISRPKHSLRNLKPHIIMRAKLRDNMNEWVRVHILPWGRVSHIIFEKLTLFVFCEIRNHIVMRTCEACQCEAVHV